MIFKFLCQITLLIISFDVNILNIGLNMNKLPNGFIDDLRANDKAWLKKECFYDLIKPVDLLIWHPSFLI